MTSLIFVVIFAEMLLNHGFSAIFQSRMEIFTSDEYRERGLGKSKQQLMEDIVELCVYLHKTRFKNFKSGLNFRIIG